MKNTSRLHCFSPQVAKKYGLNSSILFQDFNSQTVESTDRTVTYEDLLIRHPYFTHKQIQYAFKPLLFGTGDNPPLMDRKQPVCSRHYQYTLLSDSKEKYDPQELDSLYVFDVSFAVKHDVVPAIAYHNLCRWIIESWQLDTNANPDEPHKTTRHYISPRTWARMHDYISEGTAARTFEYLQSIGHLIKGGKKGGCIPGWSVPDAVLKKLLDAADGQILAGPTGESKTTQTECPDSI